MQFGKRIWVARGLFQRTTTVAEEISPAQEKQRFDDGMVRLTVGDLGTEIKWHAQTPCMTSLFVIIDWLREVKPPFVLRFNVSGWFEEFYHTPGEAAARIEAIMSRCDRHFPKRTFVEEVDANESNISPLLMDVLNKKNPPEEFAVECSYDDALDKFTVEKVGERSPIAKFYGTYTSSFPCATTSYGESVSDGYRKVLITGKPRVDHVLAAFRLPDNQVHWVPYHRLILPVTQTGRSNRVHVISQISPVNFKVI